MSLTTKRALAKSLKKLLSKRGLDKITVKDIVEDCGVNRQTFYYHFHDIYDLTEWIIQDDAENILSAELDYSDWKVGIRSVIMYIQQNRNLILNAYNSVSHEVVADYLKKLLRPYILQIVQREAKDLDRPPQEEDVDFLADMYTLMAAGIVMEWIGRRMEMQGTEERLKKLFAATDGSFCFMLNNLEKRRNT
ncbi:transcriptional regulator, TetR family [Oscillibacter sp. PC13]|jgi:probable dihydroxyacetone kinase regulator|uniref:TetR/AcrR family transcriptional regulator C-terminal domain-containing protein n=1 Tax=Oscillibacter sp. PC13 TaxID=1855299 RepID=UPI0008EED151|nr:TetR/AcrR family transcriptional regulator C-terminal domain-containing protein [Oscillibacter sp. PC13]SFQ05395.1 transcriptional regulator, TetR family [Oscillibacter sp. PC13]